MTPERQFVRAVLESGTPLKAVRVDAERWLFAPEALAEFASEVEIPSEVILLGTLVQPIDLYSSDSVQAVEAARWIVEQYGDLVEQTVAEWETEGGLQPEDDGLPADTVY